MEWLGDPRDFHIEIERWLVNLANRIAKAGCNWLTGTQVDLYPHATHNGRPSTKVIIRGTMAVLRET